MESTQCGHTAASDDQSVRVMRGGVSRRAGASAAAR